MSEQRVDPAAPRFLRTGSPAQRAAVLAKVTFCTSGQGMTFGDRQPGIDCLDDPPHGVDQRLGFPDVRMFSTASVTGVVTDALYRSLREPGQPTLFSPPMKNPFDRNFTADAGGIWA